MSSVPPADTRHYGIDALRILSIFMVLVLHILGLGGIADAAAFPEPRFLTAWTLEAAAYCAVNCYALITGFVMIQGKYRYTNLILLWLQVALFSVLGTVLFYFLKPGSVSKLTLLLSPFPVFRKTFWYFSCYFVLYLLIPFCNRALHSLSRRQAKVLCVLLVLSFSVLPTLMNVDAFGLGGGYSPLWLMALYIIGACIRKFDLGATIKSWVLVGGFVLSVLVSVGLFALLHLEPLSALLKVWRKSLLILYTSPTILFNGIALFLLFTRIQFKRTWIIKIIRLLSPVTFGVYILHTHPQIGKVFFMDKPFAVFADYPIPLMILAVLISAVAMFVFFGAVDRLRIWVFDILKLKKRLLALEEKYLGDLWATKK